MSAVSGPLAGRTVVVCRPALDSAALIERLEHLGAVTVALPLLEPVAAADGGRALAAALDDLTRFRWLALTSANGVRAVVDALSGRPLPDPLRVAAVGSATAAALSAAGIEVDLVPSTATAADLAAAFPPADGEAVLAPLAERASPDLVDGLRRRGYRPCRVEAYRMAPCSADGSVLTGADAAVITSPSIAERFVSIAASVAPPPVVACIGPRTAAAAGRLGLIGLAVAEPHNDDGLVRALLHALTPGTAAASGVGAT